MFHVSLSNIGSEGGLFVGRSVSQSFEFCGLKTTTTTASRGKSRLLLCIKREKCKESFSNDDNIYENWFSVVTTA